MRVKRYLNLVSKRNYLYVKSLGLSALVPFFIIYIILPALCFLSYKKYGVGERMYNDILEYLQMLLPFSSVWWMILILREFTDSDGSEALSICQSKIRLPDLIRLFITAFINIIVIFIPLIKIFSNMKLELIRIFLISIFYFGFVYFLSYLTKSATITIMITLAYTFASVLLYKSKMMFPLYFSIDKATARLLFGSYLPLGAIGGVTTLLGLLLNRFYKAIR